MLLKIKNNKFKSQQFEYHLGIYNIVYLNEQ